MLVGSDDFVFAFPKLEDFFSFSLIVFQLFLFSLSRLAAFVSLLGV